MSDFFDNKIFQGIFGAVLGPAVPIAELASGHKADAAASTAGVAIAGTTAATIATLGAAAPAAAPIDAAAVGGAAAADAAADTAVAAPAVADAATAGAAAGAGAATTGADIGTFAAPDATANAGLSAAQIAKLGTNAAGSVMKVVAATQSRDAAQESTAMAPYSKNASTYESPNIVGLPSTNAFNTIFGNIPAPSLTTPQLASIAPAASSIPMIQPPALVSDRRLKTNIQPATRSIKDFLKQLNGIK